MSAEYQVQVMRNPRRADKQRWLVACGYCGGGGFLARVIAPPIGWASTWRAAYDFAARHAIEHEQTRCTTCLHVPEAPVPSTPSRGVRP